MRYEGKVVASRLQKAESEITEECRIDGNRRWFYTVSVPDGSVKFDLYTRLLICHASTATANQASVALASTMAAL